MLNHKDHVHFWRELERIEQRLSMGTGASLGRLYDSMGRPGLQSFTNYGNDLAAGLARVDRIRQALDQSGPMARQLMMKQLAGIDLSAIWDLLVGACKEIALYYGGAVVTGAVAGGAIGAIAFGVGAAPVALIGTAAGAEIGMWVLALLGLKELAKGLASMLPAALEHYERGFREAWGATPADRHDTWRATTSASGNTYTGAWHMAQGHVIMVNAILTALVAYLTRGKGNKALLLQEIRQSSRLGPKFADWVIENERKLLGNKHLQARPSTPTAMSAESLPVGARGLHTSTTPQKVVASGSSNFSAVYGKAPAAKIEIDAMADDIAKMFGGNVAKASIKSQERALQKIMNDYGGDATRIKDLARNTIIVPPEQINLVAAQLANRGANVKVINGAIDPLGYSGVNSTIKTKAGIFGEIQVNSPAMIYAKEPEALGRALLGDSAYNSVAARSGVPGGLGHSFYEQWRVLSPDSTEALSIAQQSQTYYEAVRRANGY